MNENSQSPSVQALPHITACHLSVPCPLQKVQKLLQLKELVDTLLLCNSLPVKLAASVYYHPYLIVKGITKV